MRVKVRVRVRVGVGVGAGARVRVRVRLRVGPRSHVLRLPRLAAAARREVLLGSRYY